MVNKDFQNRVNVGVTYSALTLSSDLSEITYLFTSSIL